MNKWTPVQFQGVSVPDIPNITQNRGILTGFSLPQTITPEQVNQTVNEPVTITASETPVESPKIEVPEQSQATVVETPSTPTVAPRKTYSTGVGGLRYTLGSDLDTHLINESKKYGVDPNLVRAVMKQESNWTHGGKGNTSSAGAYGYMQLMPATAKDLGVDRMDPYQNISGGIRELANMYKKFGNWEDALRGYNAGPGTVLAVQAGRRRYAKETLDYVPKVMGYYTAFKQGKY